MHYHICIYLKDAGSGSVSAITIGGDEHLLSAFRKWYDDPSIPDEKKQTMSVDAFGTIVVLKANNISHYSFQEHV